MEQANKLYVGNMNYDTTEDDLRDFFVQNGIEPKSVAIITDKYTGRSKGFGFVEVESDAVLQEAVNKLNEQELNGRNLTINKAQPPKERSDRGRGGYGGGGGGRSGGFGERRGRR